MQALDAAMGVRGLPHEARQVLEAGVEQPAAASVERAQPGDWQVARVGAARRLGA